MRTPDSIAALAFEIRSFAAVSTKLMGREMEQALAEHWPGIGAPHYQVMRTLECHPATIKELSDQMMLAPSTLVPIIDRLEKDGLVTRGKDPDDRRRTPLVLTPDARHRLAVLPGPDAGDRLHAAIEAMGIDKSRQLSALLQELVEHLAPGENIVEHILSVSLRREDPAAARRRKE